jgi:hypothetical protein
MDWVQRPMEWHYRPNSYYNMTKSYYSYQSLWETCQSTNFSTYYTTWDSWTQDFLMLNRTEEQIDKMKKSENNPSQYIAYWEVLLKLERIEARKISQTLNLPPQCSLVLSGQNWYNINPNTIFEQVAVE